MAYRQVWGPEQYLLARKNGCDHDEHKNDQELCDECKTRYQQDMKDLDQRDATPSV